MKSNNVLFLSMVLSLQLTRLNIGLIADIYGGQLSYCTDFASVITLRLCSYTFHMYWSCIGQDIGANEIVIILVSYGMCAILVIQHNRPCFSVLQVLLSLL